MALVDEGTKGEAHRQLTAEDLKLINEVKALGEELGVLHRKLSFYYASPRWLAIGETHLQQGLMAWTRAVAKPDFF